MTPKRVLSDSRAQAVLLLGPTHIIYAVFALYPMVDVVVLSFQKWNGLDPVKQFVGTSNYVDTFTKDPVFWVTFRNTIIWTVLSVIFPPIIGLLLALGLNQPIMGRNTLRAIYYLPVIIAPIAVATMRRWMYDPFFGLFVQVLTAVGLQSWVQGWLGNRDIALYSVFVAHVLRSVGFSMVLFPAGLQGVNRTPVEAARIDGAGRWNVFRLVTQMLALWALTQSIQIFDFGRGSAISVVLLLITLAVIVPYLHWTQKREEVE
ncbi:MAG: sugar ABC transporter permease [Candidatus Devosia euplotis]|nr:sugar ABC transporter permease [Candidatus Devosia euplotis]